MRVFQIEGDWGFDNLRLADRPEPEPDSDQVIVTMRAASLNSRDLIVPERGYGRATGELPLIPVSDGVGEVVEVGDKVSLFKKGDRVCPTYFQNWFGGTPDKKSFALTDLEAATLPCAALTAWSAIATYGKVSAGDKVLVQGTGGVALFALAFARLRGAHVTVISSSDEKLKRVSKMGADETINYTDVEDWARASRDITADRGGFDHIVELGGTSTLPLSLRAIKPAGTVSLIGVLSGLAMEASLGSIVTRQVRLQGITVGHRQGFESMLAAMDLHKIKPVLGENFAFDELKTAMNHLRDGGHFGKTTLSF